MKTATPPCAHGEPDAVTNRKSGSAGGGEENHRPKGRHGASPPTQPPPGKRSGAGPIEGRRLPCSPRKPGKVPEVAGCLESEQSRFAASVEIAKEQPVTTVAKATKAGLAATSPDT